MRIKVCMSDEDVKEALEMGKARNQKSKRFGEGTYNKKDSGEEVHTRGILGEMAVAKMFCMEINKEIYATHGDFGHDFEIPGIGKVEVKTVTFITDPHLKVEYKKIKKEIDAYVLCCLNRDDYSIVEVVGWISKKDLIKLDQKRKYGKGLPLNYYVTESQLNRFVGKNIDV